MRGSRQRRDLVSAIFDGVFFKLAGRKNSPISQQGHQCHVSGDKIKNTETNKCWIRSPFHRCFSLFSSLQLLLLLPSRHKASSFAEPMSSTPSSSATKSLRADAQPFAPKSPPSFNPSKGKYPGGVSPSSCILKSGTSRYDLCIDMTHEH